MWNDDKKVLLEVSLSEDGILKTIAKINVLTEQLNAESEKLKQMISIKESGSAPDQEER